MSNAIHALVSTVTTAKPVNTKKPAKTKAKPIVRIEPAQNETDAQANAENNPHLNAEQILESVILAAPPSVIHVAPAVSQGVKFRLSGIVQSTLAGDRLLAHTTAYLEVSGAYEGKSMPLWSLMIGSSALAYHKKAARLVHAGDGYYKLSPEGIAFFKARKVARPLVDSYATAMQTGVIPEGLSKHPMIAV